MFLELYYAHYAERDKKAYWREPTSLPYGFLVKDVNDRRKIDAMLDNVGFECVVRENSYPLVLVNFTLKRYGRIPKACSTSMINDVPYTLEQFFSLLDKYKKAPPYHHLKNNYALSAVLSIYSTISTLRENAERSSSRAVWCDRELKEIADYRATLCDFIERNVRETSCEMKQIASSVPDEVRRREKIREITKKLISGGLT